MNSMRQCKSAIQFLLRVGCLFLFVDLARCDEVTNLVSAMRRFENNICIDVDGEVEFTDSSDETFQTAEFTAKLRIRDLRGLFSEKTVTRRPGSPPSMLQQDTYIQQGNGVVRAFSLLNEDLTQRRINNFNQGMVLYSSDVGGSKAARNESLQIGMYECGILCWWVGRTPLAYMIEQQKVKEVNRSSQGRYVLKSVGDYGELYIETSLATGWLPQKVTLKKQISDKCFSGTLRDFLVNPEADDELAVGSKPKEQPAVSPSPSHVVWNIDIPTFERTNSGEVLPKSIESSMKISFGDFKIQTLTTRMDLRRLEFDKPVVDSELTTDLVFPNGFPVTAWGADHLPYVWNGEKVLPGLPTLTSRGEKIVRKHDGLSVAWLVSINLLLVTLLVLFIWIRRYSNKGKN